VVANVGHRQSLADAEQPRDDHASPLAPDEHQSAVPASRTWLLRTLAVSGARSHRRFVADRGVTERLLHRRPADQEEKPPATPATPAHDSGFVSSRARRSIGRAAAEPTTACGPRTSPFPTIGSPSGGRGRSTGGCDAVRSWWPCVSRGADRVSRGGLVGSSATRRVAGPH
jgi:hypothetical protein